MSGVMDSVKAGFDRRMTLRRRMLDHLDIDPTEQDAPALYHDLRATLLCCGRCTSPDICEGWLDQRREGAPLFCSGREAFAQLAAACAAIDDSRDDTVVYLRA